MTVAEALTQFISGLELTAAQQDGVSRQHVYLREKLTQLLTVEPQHGAKLSGSYARSTAVRPLDDVDIFLVLRPTASCDPDRHSPAQALAVVKGALERIYDGKVARRQNRSVNIEFSGTGVAYDVVPAFVSAPGVFRIPDFRAGAWIRTNPERHKELSVHHNAATSGELKPLTKALKHWNRRLPESAQLRSFLLEVMAWDVIVSKPTDRLAGLHTLFNGLAARVMRGTPDPAGLGEALDIDLSYTERAQAAARFGEVARRLVRVDELVRAGRGGDAHRELVGIFGPDYPGR